MQKNDENCQFLRKVLVGSFQECKPFTAFHGDLSINVRKSWGSHAQKCILLKDQLLEKHYLIFLKYEINISINNNQWVFDEIH